MKSIVIEPLQAFALGLIGLAGGFAVGSAFVALLIVLDLIPRLVQLTRSNRKSILYESSLLLGALFWSSADLYDWRTRLPEVLLLLPAIFQGVFVGMFAAALTEVLNVIPIVTKRLQLGKYLFALLMAMVLGKVAGSLTDWLWLTK